MVLTPSPEWLTHGLGAALARAKARLDTLDYYPEPVRMERRAHPRRAVVLPHPRLPPLPRLRALADDPAEAARRRPTISSRTSSATSGRGSTARCT